MTRRAPYVALGLSLVVLAVMAVLYVREVHRATTWCFDPVGGDAVTLSLSWRPWHNRPLDHAVGAALVTHTDLGEEGFALSPRNGRYLVITAPPLLEDREILATLTAGACREGDSP